MSSVAASPRKYPKRGQVVKQEERAKRSPVKGPPSIEQQIERALANCFGAKPSRVRPLAKRIVARDDMGLDLLDPALIADLIALLKEHVLPHAHTALTAAEICHVVITAIDWIKKKLETGQANMEANTAVTHFRETARAYVAAQADELRNGYDSRAMSTADFEHRQGELEITREVLERAIR